MLSIGQCIQWGNLLDGEAVQLGRGQGAVADAMTYQTAQSDIFVGGDVYTGPKFAIDAIAAGKQGAISLHRYVHPGQTLTAGRDRRVYKALDKDHVLIETAGFDKDHRQTPGYNAAKAKTFSDARVTFTEEQVRRECARCLGCGATKVDSYLCIGCGLCQKECKKDAIHVVNGVAVIDYDKCVGCKLCTKVCPRDAILPKATAEEKEKYKAIKKAQAEKAAAAKKAQEPIIEVTIEKDAEEEAPAAEEPKEPSEAEETKED